jgi:hypothetical protein
VAYPNSDNERLFLKAAYQGPEDNWQICQDYCKPGYRRMSRPGYRKSFDIQAHLSWLRLLLYISDTSFMPLQGIMSADGHLLLDSVSPFYILISSKNSDAGSTLVTSK